MKTYAQRCGLAKTLDVLGDRWTLLIIRELSLRESRYIDLRRNLPGIASNLLAQRLRDLEAAGVIERRHAPPPVQTALYALTARGEQLVPALDALTVWGYPMLPDAPDDDLFRLAWVAALFRALLRDVDATPPELCVELVGPSESERIAFGADCSVTLAPSRDPDATITGEFAAIWAYLTTANAAAPRALTVTGDLRRMRELRKVLTQAVAHAR